MSSDLQVTFYHDVQAYLLGRGPDVWTSREAVD